ncbi:16S rRNA (guanine(527)-N(7))-methyltransferase RsmG [Flaviflexus huanghaiensis]|uniref:16S rRNA (guanine(527)-N(7))-methyltransferase RsmG n=1 Tax=Flaviflexus huanghaiensis TaxID=1111473 RepID=UPI0015FE401C|nr:16S rRNA (guanine(527)-N(7))-methyltransferase RsmG [Flaviflexus huanghaiensis]
MRNDDTPANGPELLGDSWTKLDAYAQMLWDEGEERGLIGPRELPRLWSRHILNSMAINEFIPRRAVTIDIGSGSGLPGIVLAATRPDVHVHLVESMERRVFWLDEVTEALELSNVTIHRNRIQDLHGEFQVQVVTARAVAALKKLVPMAFPVLKSGGFLVALKGERADAEIDDARPTFKKNKVAWVDMHVVDVPGTSEATRVVVAQKK